MGVVSNGLLNLVPVCVVLETEMNGFIGFELAHIWSSYSRVLIQAASSLLGGSVCSQLVVVV